jgi:hypothetical protein
VPDQRPSPSPVERIVEKDRADNPGVGRPLSRTSMQYQRTLEGYLKAGNRPRWMERIAEIDRGVKDTERRLSRMYDQLLEETGGEPDRFARRWREIARGWSFDKHNTLVRQHNEWYPIERQLAVNPVTGEYVAIHGRSFRRPELDATWILERFPPDGRAAA